ncbi:hypothetical protein [Paenibacillus lutrae]|uniref:Uncharacterized protein n=1 Tax=Paenibacillus lutrae TaxID=2078573 RepID=A0A7X3FK32_9BACL|nr:hypothetical protein [Paenibacillus lutrae]MVP01062.1 hypothetical protein [Paenibacillus lutrae]
MLNNRLKDDLKNKLSSLNTLISQQPDNNLKAVGNSLINNLLVTIELPEVVFQKVFYFYLVKEYPNDDAEKIVFVTLDLDQAIENYLKGDHRRIEIWAQGYKLSEYWGDLTHFNEIKETIVDYFY